MYFSPRHVNQHQWPTIAMLAFPQLRLKLKCFQVFIPGDLPTQTLTHHPELATTYGCQDVTCCIYMKIHATRHYSVMITVLAFMIIYAHSNVIAGTRVLTIYWNSSNPIFRIDNTDHIFDVNLGNVPFEYDQLNIVCPVYNTTPVIKELEEKYIIYSVSREEFETCRIVNPSPKVIAACDKPHKPLFFTITFRSFTPTPGGLEFRPGEDYYFISTSSTEDIHRRIGGRCQTQHMKVIFKVCCKKHNLAVNDAIGRHLNPSFLTTLAPKWSGPGLRPFDQPRGRDWVRTKNYSNDSPSRSKAFQVSLPQKPSINTPRKSLPPVEVWTGVVQDPSPIHLDDRSDGSQRDENEWKKDELQCCNQAVIVYTNSHSFLLVLCLLRVILALPVHIR